MLDAGRHFGRWLLLLWLVTAGWIIALSWSGITAFRIPDPDDIMRLVEVRDWLSGQGWFDVSQHRMNPPHGLSMHWSRMVDVPIGVLILAARLFVSPHMAETIAIVVVPMITLGFVMTLVALLVRRWLSPGFALFAAGIAPTSVAVWYALRPMRIDHHGWQIAAGLGIALALTGPATRKNAAIAGLCAAVWTQISLEGLPFAAAAAAWLGLRAMMGGKAEVDRLSAYLASFTIGAAALLLAFRGPGAFAGLTCDAIATVHLAALGLATLVSVMAGWAPRRLRIAILIVGAVGDAVFYRLCADLCMAGPFGQLGPLGYRIWYSGVNEGLPLWRLVPELSALWGPLPIVGLAGAVWAWTRLPKGAAREPLSTYIVLLAAATAIGALVMRASGFANMLAMPGAMMALATIVRAAGSWPRIVRMSAITLAVVLCTPLGPALACLVVVSGQKEDAPASVSGPACGSLADYAVLNRLPPSVVMAPIGPGPAVIAATHHTVLTGPYHRDPDALEDLLRFFMASPDAAQAVDRARDVRFLAFCPADHDIEVMAAKAPAGLAAAIRRGDVAKGAVPWLHRVYLPGGGPLQVYRIAPPSSPLVRE